jgi:hypothetical protein
MSCQTIVSRDGANECRKLPWSVSVCFFGSRSMHDSTTPDSQVVVVMLCLANIKVKNHTARFVEIEDHRPLTKGRTGFIAKLNVVDPQSCIGRQNVFALTMFRRDVAAFESRSVPGVEIQLAFTHARNLVTWTRHKLSCCKGIAISRYGCFLCVSAWRALRCKGDIPLCPQAATTHLWRLPWCATLSTPTSCYSSVLFCDDQSRRM